MPPRETTQPKTKLAAGPAGMAAGGLQNQPRSLWVVPDVHLPTDPLKKPSPFGSMKRAVRSKRPSSLHTHTRLSKIKYF